MGVAAVYGGVETGGTWCVCALGTGPGDIGPLTRFRTTSPEETLGRVVEFFREHGVPCAIGVGAFGPLDLDPESPTWGCVTTSPKTEWQQTPVASVIRDELQVRVAFDTDVNAAALAEHRWGAGRKLPSVCYLTVGTGVGAGLIIDGRPLRGLIHPEAGHIRVPHDLGRDPFPGCCPVHGDCWEGLASGTAMSARWELSAEELPDEHPAWALEAEYLALGILSIVLIASPHMVIAGGGVMQRALLLPLVRARLRGLLAGYLDTPMLGPRIDSYLVAPALGDRAGVLGALALAQLDA